MVALVTMARKVSSAINQLFDTGFIDVLYEFVLSGRRVDILIYIFLSIKIHASIFAFLTKIVK